MEIVSNIRFAYFKANTPNGLGVICVALKRPERGSSSTTYRAGFSFYSPNETEAFSKSIARKIAAGRLNNWRTTNKMPQEEEVGLRLEFNFSESDCSKFNLTEVFAYAMKEMLPLGAPRWAVKAFEQGELYVGLTEDVSRQCVL